MITTLSGSNHFLLQKELHKTINEFTAKYSALAVERFDAEEASSQSIFGAMTSEPFLVEKKLVVVRNPSSNKDLAKDFEDKLEKVSDSTDVIFVELKPDKRTTLFKTLKTKTNFQEYDDLKENELVDWLMSEANEKGAQLSRSDANYLLSKIGPNQQLLAMELQKLTLFDKNISKTTIDGLVEALPRSKVFDLLDSAFYGDTQKALQIYKEQRQLRVEPQEIMGLLSWQLHVLAIIKTAGQKSPDEIAKEAQINPYVIRKSLNLARKIPFQQLKALISYALNLDVRMKSESIDSDEAMKLLIIKLAN